MNTTSTPIKTLGQNTVPSAGMNSVSWWAALLLVLVSTVFRGGNRYAPLLVLEWLALVLLLVTLFERLIWSEKGCAVSPHDKGRVPALALLLSAPLWLPAVQLMHWSPIWHPSSVVPAETWLSMLAGLPWVACLVLALMASAKQIRTLVMVWIGVGVCQAILGMMQLAFPALLFEPNTSTPVLGTFGNRNGLANFLAMLLPLVVSMLLPSKQPVRKLRSGHQPDFWLTAGALLILCAGLTATLSRAGIATGVMALGLAMSLLLASARRTGDRGRRATWLLAIMALVALAFVAAGWDWLDRFETKGLGDALRVSNHASTWEAAVAYWPLGSGLGTFGVVFPQFASSEMGAYFVNFAHNDYLELLMEAGALVLPPTLAAIWLVVHRTRRLIRSHRIGFGDADRLATACGIGLLAQALHAWVDYPWQIPANAMLGAFMLGVFLRAPDGHVRDTAAP